MSANDILVIDNFIPKSAQDEISNLCFSPGMGWYFNHSAGYSKEVMEQVKLPDNTLDVFQFTHRVIDEGKILSSSYPIFGHLITALPFSNVVVKRIKLNLTTRVASFKEYNFGSPHTDHGLEHSDNYMTAIYYVNDSDGDTIIFNESTLGANLTVKQRITPKKGRIVIFDGHVLHSPSNPIVNDLRCVVNLNFITE
jgi:hypothetical protein